MIFLDCNKSKAGVDLEDDRKKRVQSIEKQIKLLAPEIRDLIHFVAFLPQCTQSDDLTTMISYTKLKEDLLNENS